MFERSNSNVGVFARTGRLLTAALLPLTTVVVGVAMVADPVAAATTTKECVTHPYSVTEVNFASDLPQFNPALGTFVNATITATASLKTTFHFTSSAVTTTKVKGTSTSELTTTGPSGVEPALQVDVSLSTPLTSIDPGQTVNVGPLENTANTMDVSTDALRWVGVGTVPYSTESLSGFQLQGGGGNIAASQETVASFEICVVYQYDIPTILPVSVGNFVWVDSNGNGIQDGGEPGIPGVTVTISLTGGGTVLNVDGTPLGTLAVQTDANGLYQFAGLAPGAYTVTVTPPAGYVPTLTGQGTTATDSSTGSAASAVLAGGEADQTLDFGFVKPVVILPVSVGNFVWSDSNGNGIQDGGEPGIAGVTVTISLTGGGTVRNVDGSPLATLAIQTDANGLYQFAGLAPGAYTVTVTPPAGYVPTLTGQGTTATDSSTGSAASAVLASGGTDQTLDFGFVKPAVVPPVSVGNSVGSDNPISGPQPVSDMAPLPISDSQPLPVTGSDSLLLVLGGVGLLGIGLLAVAATRRRRIA